MIIGNCDDDEADNEDEDGQAVPTLYIILGPTQALNWYLLAGRAGADRACCLLARAAEIYLMENDGKQRFHRFYCCLDLPINFHFLMLAFTSKLSLSGKSRLEAQLVFTYNLTTFTFCKFLELIFQVALMHVLLPRLLKRLLRRPWRR